MKNYNFENLRNVGLIGHGATGKTSLAEALLYYTGTTDRLGKNEDGTTVMDYEVEEKKRGISLSTSIACVESNNTKINIVDMPGYFDFEGEMIQGMKAIDIATIVVCAVSGVQVGTEKAWDYCEKIKLPRAFFINKMDRENADFDKILEEIKTELEVSENLSVSSSAINNLELTPKSVTKATAISALQDYYGVNKEETVAFGDGMNDLEMFGQVHYSVAMGNASELVKKEATYETLSNLDSGISHFLKFLSSQ